jgi:hypothetical protein
MGRSRRSESVPIAQGTSDSKKIRHRAFHFSRGGDVAPSTAAAGVSATDLLCRSGNDPHMASSFQAVGVVIGLRNWSRASRRSAFLTFKPQL